MMVNYYNFTMDCVKPSVDIKAPLIIKKLLFEVIKHTSKESEDCFSIWFEDDDIKSHQCITEEMSIGQLKELYKFLKIVLEED
tara:strand:+ start:1526 stop:1774 length:249 start_codon:yes stop_codon:yes gene_type:complete